MSHLDNTLHPRLHWEQTPISFSLRLGRREIFVTRDFRRRFYWVNPLLDCSAGLEKGHVELLVFRRWLVVLSKAH